MDKRQFQNTPLCRGNTTPAMVDSEPGCRQARWFRSHPHMAREFLAQNHRPFVTVSYAQSVDGSIATRNREQLQLSSKQSMILTHRIRAACDAIVIGINTLLADNPLLTVRLAEGTSPQPIVLDSHLRTPFQARLLERTDRRCWLACTDSSAPGRIGEFEGRGAEIIRCDCDRRGRVDLRHLLQSLGKRGISSVMVEGGGQVITSFIEARLVDQMIITIAPRLVGGLSVLARPAVNNGTLLNLDPAFFQACGPDIILWAQPQWREA